MAGCGTPEGCGPVPCSGFLWPACCPCVRHPDCDIGDDDNNGDPYCPAECIAGYVEPPTGNGWTDGGGGTAIDQRDPQEEPEPPGPGPIDPDWRPDSGGDPGDPGGDGGGDGGGGRGGGRGGRGGVLGGGGGVGGRCYCEMEMTPTITYGPWSYAFNPPCRHVEMVWKQECKYFGPGNGPQIPQSFTQAGIDHPEGIVNNPGDVNKDCRDKQGGMAANECTGDCPDISFVWIQCMGPRDTVPPPGGGGGGGDDHGGTPTQPTTPGGTSGWRCVDTQGVKGCIFSTFFGPNETRYPSKGACEAVCNNEAPGPPRITPPPGGGVAGPTTPGGGGNFGYRWICKSMPPIGLKRCVNRLVDLDNLPPNAYASEAECRESCRNDTPPPGGGIGGGPATTPGEPGNPQRWRCTSTGGSNYCQQMSNHVPGIVTYRSKAACEVACLRGQPDLVTPSNVDPRDAAVIPEGETDDGDGTFLGGDFDPTTGEDTGSGNGDGTFLGGDFDPATGEDTGSGNGGGFTAEPLTPDDLGPTDYSLDPYDDLYNIRISKSALFSDTATLGESTGGLDPYNIFRPIISKVLLTMLAPQGTNSYVPYNGTTISGFIYNRNIIVNSLSSQIRVLLYKLNNSNMVSLNLTEMMLRALKRAVYKNTYREYTPQLLEEMISSMSILKEPIPVRHNQAYPITNRSLGLERARHSKYSMYPGNHAESGDMQRKVQMYYMPPTDYDLKVPVYTREGTITGVRVGQDSAVNVVARSSKDGTVPSFNVPVKEVNDYLTVRRRAGDVAVTLKSHRSKAMAFNMPDLSIIQGYLKLGNEGTTDDLKYSFNLDVSTGPEDNIEISGADTLLGAYLVQLDTTSLTDVPNQDINFRTTTCTYDLAWSSTASPKLFEAAVSAHSGPRNTVYINADDPWWMHFQKTKTLTATYTDLDIDGLDGYLYPRRINTDMLLVPVAKVKYDPLQGESSLIQYGSEGTIRRLKVTVSPLKEVYSKSYAAPAKKEDGRSWGNYHDAWALKYDMNFNVENTRAEVGTTDKMLSQPSMLGKLISRITDIKSSYNLETGTGGLGLPKVDLFSFFTVNEIVEFLLSVPADIRLGLFAGVYTEVKLFDIKISDLEKSYITTDRLLSKGKDLESLRHYTSVPTLDSTYFPDKYEGILFRYASRT